MKMTRRSFLSASAFTLLACGLAPAAHAEETNSLLTGLLGSKAENALPPKPLTAKVVDANPFMGFSESNIHHDCYNTDSTDAVLPHRHLPGSQCSDGKGQPQCLSGHLL